METCLLPEMVQPGGLGRLFLEPKALGSEALLGDFPQANGKSPSKAGREASHARLTTGH